MIRLAGLAPLCLVLASAAAQPPLAAQVVIDGTAYVPPEMTVERGTRVTWVNRDPFPHTATAPGKFDSGSIAAGGRWSFVAKVAGRYDYICTLHPNMKGTLLVR